MLENALRNTKHRHNIVGGNVTDLNKQNIYIRILKIKLI